MPRTIRRRCLTISLLLALNFSSTFAQDRKPAINEERSQLTIDGRLLLDARKDGFMSIERIKPSPVGTHFVVLACGFECNDNIGFLFEADGDGKRRITGHWDRILQSKIEWSADGRKLFYYRINSTGAEAPQSAPPEGWVEVDPRTLRKSPAANRRLKTDVSYGVFNVGPNDALNLRAAPGRTAAIVASIPRDAKGVKVTGAGVAVGRERWAPVEFKGIAGWVNQRYLYEEPESN